jgi:excisionase family DNA binding protein
VTLSDIFGPEAVRLIEELIDARVREALAAQNAKPWMTVKEASIYLGISEVATRRRISRNRIPVKRSGRSVLVDRVSLDRELGRR